MASLLDRLAGIGSMTVERALGGLEGMLKANGATAPVVEEAKDPPTSLFWDPFSIIEQLGYKEKPGAITYGTLQAMVWRLPLIHAIILTRINQVAAFARPQRDLFQVGFRVKLVDSTAKPSPADRKFIRRAEDMIMTTGVTDNPIMREGFEKFLRKAVRDSMTLDQWCHPAGTSIETLGGYQAIEEIEVGDFVRTHTGRLRRVAELKQRKYSGLMIRAKARAQSIEMTAAHPILAIKDRWFNLTPNRGQKPEWIDASQLREGMYLCYPKPKLKVDPQETKAGPLTSEIAWMLGLYVANGNTDRGRSKQPGAGVQFTLNGADGAIADRLAAVGTGLGFKVRITTYEDRYAIRVGFATGSADWGVWFCDACGPNAGAKYIPSFIWTAEPEHQRSFLAGYLEGDGCFKGTRVSFNTTSRQLFHGLRTLFAAHGMLVSETRISEGGSPGSGWSDQSSGQTSGPAYRAFAREQGLPVVDPPKKRAAWIEDADFYYLRINEVAQWEVEDLPVYNFEVEVDHSYVANGFVSHNCFEVVKNRKGQPAAFYAVDGSTIRLADTASVYFDENAVTEEAYTVQIYDGMVIREWARDEMAFCIRNPSTSIRNYGYGIAEAEMLVTTITQLLWSIEYNSKFFQQGSAAKGLLNIKGPINQTQLDGFRRMWYQMVSGVENAWRTPVLNSEEVQWIPMHSSNRDMEFSAFMDFLIKVACGVFQMDPIEVGFKYGNQGQQRSMFEAANKQKLMESKDKGLKPLLRFIARNLTNYVIRPIDPDFELEFVGLEAQTHDELAKLNAQRVKTTHSVNELRAEYDLPPIEGGDIILDPVFAQALQMAKMAEQGLDASGQPIGAGSDQAGAGDHNNDGKTDENAANHDFGPEDFEALEGPDDIEPEAKKALLDFEF